MIYNITLPCYITSWLWLWPVWLVGDNYHILLYHAIPSKFKARDKEKRDGKVQVKYRQDLK